jgi:hypothetical protein
VASGDRNTNSRTPRLRLGASAWAYVPRRWREAGWAKLLVTWAGLIERYDGASDTDQRLKDVAYWYGERALTGLLAAAAWRTNKYWWSIEEFTGKRHVDPRLRKSRTNGAGRGEAICGSVLR